MEGIKNLNTVIPSAKVALLLLVLLSLINCAETTPDGRCVANSDCTDATTPPQCCAYKKAYDAAGNSNSKGFTCMQRD